MGCPVCPRVPHLQGCPAPATALTAHGLHPRLTQQGARDGTDVCQVHGPPDSGPGLCPRPTQLRTYPQHDPCPVVVLRYLPHPFLTSSDAQGPVTSRPRAGSLSQLLQGGPSCPLEGSLKSPVKGCSSEVFPEWPCWNLPYPRGPSTGVRASQQHRRTGLAAVILGILIRW